MHCKAPFRTEGGFFQEVLLKSQRRGSEPGDLDFFPRRQTFAESVERIA